MDRLDQIKQKFFGLAGRQKVDVFIRSAYRFLNTEELRQLMIDLVNRASETMRLMMPLRGCKIEIIDNDYSDLSIWYSICDDGMLEVTVRWKVVEFGKLLSELPELVRMYDLRITTITAAAVDAAMEFESLYFVNPDFTED